MSFRGINTTVIQIRRQVFTEVARMAYANVKGEQANHLMRKIPYTIIPGEEGKLRKDIFLERAIVEERVRLAMGLPTRRMDEHNSVVSGLEDASIADKYYDPPLVNVIKFACNRCPEKLVKVSDLCQGCLAHPCMEVCPKKAITWESGRSTIDQEKCIKCGRCVGVCPYNAIVKTERPCAAACGMGAIHSDELGRAEIDYSKCVSCGQCLVNCPFGAIADKGQIYQLIQGFNRGDRIYALVAPAFINQFPSLASTGKLKAALKAIGFCDVVEVAIGADLCTVDEAHDFLQEVPEKLNFMATSCCPAWSMMAKTAFPALAKNISMTMTPMVFTARMMKQADPEARMCFIGPCAAKKLEASRRSVRSEVDFVLTFEELMGLFEAKAVNFADLPDNPEDAFNSASADARGFAASGGVAQAVVNAIKKMDPDREVKVMSAQGLADCKKMMGLALKNVTLTLHEDGKAIFEEQGEMLFTHFGISGPLTLSASSHLGDMKKHKYEAFIDLKPALSEEQLYDRITRDFALLANHAAQGALVKLLPSSMQPVMVARWGIDPATRANQITREQKRELVQLMKHWRVTIDARGDLAHAVITSGGVSVREVDPKTMQSKKALGLYFAGEVLDVDAYTGGYNLQIAFCTAQSFANNL